MDPAKSNKPINYVAYAAVVLVVMVILAVPFVYKKRTVRESVTYTKLQMGTIVEISIMGGDPGRFDKAAKKAFREIKRLEGLMSSYKPLSDVSRISANAGVKPVVVSPEVLEVTLKAIEVAELSNGAFDPTIGSLARLWGFSGESGVVPGKGEVEKVLPLVDYRNIIVDKDASTVFLNKRETAFNLGGIAKGYIVGQAVGALRVYGVTRAIIKAGGDMFALNAPGLLGPGGAGGEGGAEGAGPFRIGIKHPRDKEKLLGEAHLENGAVATSGDYERFFESDGVMYHHILDPETGYPARRSRSVTVVTEDPTLADALSTSVFVMGPIEGMRLVEGLPGVEALIVDSEGKITKSSGFKGRVL
jgi:thiamine biosynthesis lipoprotein